MTYALTPWSCVCACLCAEPVCIVILGLIFLTMVRILALSVGTCCYMLLTTWRLYMSGLPGMVFRIAIRTVRWLCMLGLPGIICRLTFRALRWNLAVLNFLLLLAVCREAHPYPEMT